MQIDGVAIHVRQPEAQAFEVLSGYIDVVLGVQVHISHDLQWIGLYDDLLQDISLTQRTDRPEVAHLRTNEVDGVMRQTIEGPTFKDVPCIIPSHTELSVANEVIQDCGFTLL